MRLSEHHLFKLLTVLILASAGITLVLLFLIGVVPPLRVGLVLLFGLAVWGVATAGPRGVLSRLFIVVYTLPFVALTGYLFDPGFVWWRSPRAILYSSDRLLLGQMVAVGTIGLVGLLAGMRVATLASGPHQGVVPASGGKAAVGRSWPTLPPLPFCLLVIVAVFLSWLSAPTKSIFAADYADAGTAARAESLNFSSAFLLSYVLLLLLQIDAERETRSPGRRRAKYVAVLAVSAFIVVVFQLLRGDRESWGLIVAMMALYLTSPSGRDAVRRAQAVVWRRARSLALVGLALLLVFLGVGSARFTLAGDSVKVDPVASIRSGLAQNTASAVLLTNLSVAAQYRYGPMQYFAGRTYLDYLRSLPPGPVTNALGIERPLEATRGPGWWTQDVASGGAHAAIVPFKNFGVSGVFLVLALYGYAIVRLDRANRVGSLWGRLFFATVAASSFLWFWYGDMSLVRGLLSAAAFGLVYRVCSRYSPTTGTEAWDGLSVDVDLAESRPRLARA